MTARQARATESEGPRPQFGVIEQQRAHEYVAEQIRRQIGLGIIAPGEALPPERELARLFGVGRVTVQLAVGVLEADRLIETRRGRGGGSFVLAPSKREGTLDYRVLEVAQSADLIREAIEYRMVVEPAAARIAARLRTESQLAEIRLAAQRLGDATNDAEFMREDTAFHLAIARATGNRFVFAALEQTRLHLNALLALLPESPAWHRLSVEEHDGVLAALAEQDGDAAESLMREHVERTGRSMHSLLKSLAPKASRRNGSF
ncbi:FadR/GntR family transcriptional regulator [Pseudonocardia sp. GCM10023141]|uniref:FadR/GntR family transcriptional regulator n=1 Tax=Pseudonocardia sp. GCM10023141 TaxID=3252653 RepID=UPI003624354B